MKNALTAFALLVLASAAGFATPPAEKHQQGEGAGVRSLDVFGHGNSLHIFFAETREGEANPRLFHRRSGDDGATWSEPIQVDAASSPAFSPHRGMDPQLAAAGDRLIAVWTTAGTDRWGSGPMATALSSDGGKSWQIGPNPADDGSTTGHGFIDITADDTGAFHSTWLDSRDGKQGLRYARSTNAGATWSPNITVMAETCECCPNTITTGPRGVIGILYRGLDPRDMVLAQSMDGGRRWSQHRAGRFDWAFQGCPHVGGGLVFGGESSVLDAVVWTGGESRSGVFHVRTATSGATWSAPRPLGDIHATHPDLAIDKAGGLAAVWERADGDARGAIWFATSLDGASWNAPAQLSRNESAATHPRVVATKDGFRAFWTETRASHPTIWTSAPIKHPR